MSDERFEKAMARILWPDSMALLFEREGTRMTPEAEKFAEIVWQAAIQSERELCAKIAEGYGANTKGRWVADAIRRGGEHEHSV